MPVQIVLSPQTSLMPANPRVTGVNVQWADQGDGMTTNGVPIPIMTQRAQELGMSGFLRYPGGFKADNFDWTKGEGALGSRQANTDTFGGSQTTYFGTQEALNLCTSTGLDLYCQTNIFGTNALVTSWMSTYPQIRNWEIGNEPELTTGLPQYWVTPAAYLATANSQIAAMLAQDPTVKIAVTVAPDYWGPIPGLQQFGFNDIVLAGLDHRIRRFDCHMYMPHGSVANSIENVYACGVAAYRVEEEFLQTCKAQIEKYGFTDYELVVSEYGLLNQINPTQNGTVFGALVCSDLIKTAVSDSKVYAAMKWSLGGNGNAGMIQSGGRRLPTYWSSRMWSNALRGDMIPSAVTGWTPLYNPRYARMYEYTDTPSMNCYATNYNGMVRAIVLNKKLSAAETVTVELANNSGYVMAGTAQITCLQPAGGTDAFDTTASETAYTYGAISMTPVNNRSIRFSAPKTSMMLVEIPVHNLVRPDNRNLVYGQYSR